MAIIKVITPSVTDANITTAKVTDNAITLAKMASGTDGNIISYDASGNPVAIATGSDGQVLTSTGAGSPPAFEALPASGRILQVVSARPTGELSTTSGSHQATATEVAITPSSTSSKIFVMVTSGLFWANSTSASAQGATATIYRNSSNLRGGTGWLVRTYRIGATSIQTSAAMSFLDSPSSTSELTYKCYVAATFGGTAQWNSSSNDIATITAMEVSG